ncbi:MAG: hypothetical protein GSR84_05210 [Desulfurococcales archaeon]|nr:hypothetical protein [Desulfurococcales archaeon]
MATKKITIEVEVPEGLARDRERVERLVRAFEAWLSMVMVRERLGDDELREIFSKVEEAVWRRHRSSST